MLNIYSDEQLRLAARLYYVDGLDQGEVARFVKVSQAKVSRLLATARERGVVRITVEEYEPRHKELEREIKSALGLASIAVIKTPPAASADDCRHAIAYFGASFVSELLANESVIAISGGRTMRKLVDMVRADAAKQLQVIQAMGSIDASIGPVDASELGLALARKTGGSFATLNVPAFVPDKKTRDAFIALPQIRTVWRQLTSADVALVGVGTLENSVFAERKAIPAGELNALKKAGAVGEICGRFYDAQGRECVSPWRERVISIELDQLKRTRQVIGVVVGSDRAAATVAAIRGKLLKSLIVDEALAQAMLAIVSQTFTSSKTKEK